MMRLFGPIIFALLGGCASIGTTHGTYSVQYVVEHRNDLAGQKINVVGTLTSCQPLSCNLSNGEYHLSIGPSEDFDDAAARYIGEEVVVSATFTGDCVSDPQAGVFAVCADRSRTLANPELISLARYFRS